jgi:vacuolar-type H+-ATPase subunit F/Vma7
MARAAVIGEAVRTAGFALAGAVVTTAETAEETRAAWRALPGDIAVLILTPHAASWLGDPGLPGNLRDPASLLRRPDMLVVVMPE